MMRFNNLGHAFSEKPLPLFRSMPWSGDRAGLLNLIVKLPLKYLIFDQHFPRS
jgi:hypothetical protein